MAVAIREIRPWNDNLLRPCPVLDNPGRQPHSGENQCCKESGNLLDYMQEYTDEFLFIEQACNSPMTTDEMLETLEQYNKDTVRIFQRGIEEGILKPASPALLISFCYYPIQQIFKEWRKDRSMLPDVDFDMVFQMCWDAVKR